MNTQPMGLQLAFLLLLSVFPPQSLRSCRGERWGGGKNVALSVLPGGAFQMPSFTLIGRQLPHCSFTC